MAKANIPIYLDMVELLKLLMREAKNMPKADNRTLGVQSLCNYQTRPQRDILWQLAGLCKTFGWTLEDVAQGNLDKLAARKAEGTIISHTDH